MKRFDMKTNRYILVFACVLWCAVGNLFAVDKSYYSSLDGKSGTALREALTTLVYTHHTTDVGYNWTFDGIDVVDGEVLDIYSTCTWTSSQQGKSYSGICDGYNREHVVPQSLFNEAAPQKTDRHHLFLTDGQVNNLRSSYPFGETNVTNAFSSLSNGSKALGKLGASSSGFTGTVYEPDDEYKGDIARAIMYMAIRYATADVCKKYGGSSNSYPVTTWSNAMFSGSLSTNYGLSANAVAMYMKWHRADPPSAKEIARNNGVEAKQGNRNPFVDLPDLAEYLWGTHKTDAVDLSNLTLSTGGGAVATPYEITLNRNGAIQTLTCTGTYTLPTALDESDACEGWPFVGWTTTSSVNSTSAPTYTTQTTVATTLYAVYSNTASSAPAKKATINTTDDLTLSTTGVSGTSYSDWSGITGSSGAVYAGQSAGGNNSIQLRSKNSNSGIITTTSGGKATKVVVVWNSNTTNGNKIDIYGKSSAYSAATDLYGSNAGTLIGSITCGTSTELTISNDYEFIGIRSNSGAVYLDKISITWSLESGGSGGGSTTTYMTSPTCGDPHTITLTNSGIVTGGEFEASASSAYAGATITLSAEPSAGYTFGSWTVTNNSTSATITVIDNQFTMPDANVTVSATFTALSTYNIRFYNNGTQIGTTQSIYAGGYPDIPSAPTACEGYTFVGWYTESLSSTNTTSHTWVEDFTVIGAQDYYAVFSKTETSGGGSGSLTLTQGPSSGSGYNTSYSTTVSTTQSNSISIASNNILNGSQNIQLKAGTGNRIYNTSAMPGNITQITVTATTNSACVYVGSSSVASGSTALTPTSGSTNGTAVYTIPSGNTYFAVGATSSYVVISNIEVVYSSGTTYYTSTTSCALPCAGQLTTPAVTATPGNGKITLTWADVTDANHYTVTIGKGVGYTTECGGEASIGDITNNAGVNSCVITGLTNGLEYTTTVVANGTAVCDSEADEDRTTPMDCNAWDDPMLTYTDYALTDGGAHATLTITGTQHGTATFSSSNVNVLTVDADGEVTPVGAGTATITAHWEMTDDYCEKDVVSSPFIVSGLLTITFHANDGTDQPATKTQTVTYNVAATLDANTFTRTGYTFQGWATTADGDKVHNDGASVTFTESTSLYAVWQINSHNVTFTPSSTGATVTVNSQSTSPQSAEYGSTVTVTVTPAAHYTLYSIEVSNGASVTIKNNIGTFIMPDEDVTVTVTMTEETKYTVDWYVNGTPTAEENYAGETLAGITAPTSSHCYKKTFVGWTETEDYYDAENAPTDLFTDPTTKIMSVGGTNYYAVFAYEETESGDPETLIAYDGSGKSTLGAIEGVTQHGLSSDYSSSTHGVYILKFDDTGDYIQFDLPSVPTALSFGYKMVGGANTSTMTIQECATATGTYSDVQAFTISGKQNDIGSFTTSNAFSQKYVRMTFTKGSNVGVGTITITGNGSVTTYSDYSTSCEYTRSINHVDDYGTLCLPYGVVADNLIGATAYSVVGKYTSGDKITGIVLKAETELEAGKPYVIQATATLLRAKYSYGVDVVDEPVEAVGLVGNLSAENMIVPVNCYGLSNNQLRRVPNESVTATIGQYKAYFNLTLVPDANSIPVSAAQRVMYTTDYEDVETPIVDMTGDSATINWNEPVYNILGQQVDRGATGVLIQNGIKYLR